MSGQCPTPDKMTALLIEETGGPEVIQLSTSFPVPTLSENEVLIKVAYAGINYIDTYFRSGLYPVEFPFQLGQECAGIVVQTTSERFKLGDKVVYYGGKSYAEYVRAGQGRVAIVPPTMDLKDATALLTQGLTALTMLRESYAVQRGEVIVVHAAAGGVGLNLLQMAKHFGVRVIGTTSTNEKAALAKKFGAEIVVVGGKDEDLKKAVNDATGGTGVHAIFDGVGKATWDVDFEILARKGTLVSFGNASGACPPFSALKLVKGNWKVTRPTLANFIFTEDEFVAYVTELFELFAAGHLKTMITQIAPFTADGLRAAHADLTGRKTVGKLLLQVSE